MYPHIAEYLSSLCVGENAEYAMMEMFEKGTSTARQAFVEKFEESVVEAMGYAVAWTIENSIRGQGAISASLKEVTGAGEEYTVVFTINKKEHSSKWVWEYGNWRIRSFGEVAAGDESLLTKKQAKKESDEKLRTEKYSFHVEGGYASLFSFAPAAMYAAVDFFGFGAKMYFAGPDFWTLGAFAGFRGDFKAGNIGFMPFARLGFDYQNDKKYKKFDDEEMGMGFPIVIMVQGGLKVTTTYVPGLFVGAGFQYNLFGMHDKDYKGDLMKMALTFFVGYAF